MINDLIVNNEISCINDDTKYVVNDVNIEKSFQSSTSTNTKLLKKYDNWKRYINNSLS